MIAWPHPTTRQVAWHESGHVASLLLADWAPLLVRVDNVPGESLLGHVKIDWDTRDVDERSIRDLLESIMQGPLSDGQPVHFDHDWPLDADTWTDNVRDARQIVFLTEWLNFDHVAYLSAVYRAMANGRQPEFRRMQVAVYSALVDREMLIQPELIELTKTVIGERNET